jgi:PAS domain S-box-containing protein
MENELNRVVDVLPGLVWTALPDGQVDFLNQRWCEYTGVNVAEACGSGWQTAIHPEDLPEFLERWRSILVSCEPGEMEARLQRFDGEYRWFLFRTLPITDASGQVAKWCGVNTDIEDRRRLEEARHSRWWLWAPARERHFRSIGDGIQAHAALVTPAGEIEIVNRQALEYFGATLEELKSRAIAETVHQDDLPNVIAAWRGAIETGRPYDVEGRHRRADGVYRWFRMRGFPLRDMEERIVLWKLISTMGNGPKLCSPVRSGYSKWWRAAVRCRKYSKRSANLSKARPADATAPSSWSIRPVRVSNMEPRRAFRPVSSLPLTADP